MTSILTSREKEVFELLITNKTTKEIAEENGLKVDEAGYKSAMQEQKKN